MSEQRNLLLTIVLAGLVLFGFYYFYERPKIEMARAQQMIQHASNIQANAIIPMAATPVSLSRDQALGQDKRVPINAPSVHGSIRLRGGVLDDVTLAHYHETTDNKSPEIKLLSPEGSSHPYTIIFGWHPSEPSVKTPTEHSLWRVAAGHVLAQGHPVTLAWDNGHGLTFERTFHIDEHYMFSMTQRVINKSDKPVRLTPYSQIVRTGTPSTGDFFILHEGPIGVLGGKLQEMSYKDLREKQQVEMASTGGWIGMTDKYWLTALIPSSHPTVITRFKSSSSHTGDNYTIEMFYPPQELPAGQTIEVSEHIFAGAKQVHLLDQYEKAYAIPRFDLAIDFGWFYFLTKPIFSFLNMIHGSLGNFGLSILLLTVLIKLVLFPLANKSYRSMAKMKKLTPELVQLKEKYADDRVKMNEAMMEMYRKHQINPLAGCLPMVMQIPVFFALYKVLFVTIEMRHAPFFGWIQDLSAPDPTTLFNLFGLLPWTPPSMLMVGAWPLLMGATMFLQQRLNPQPSDPIQAKIFMFMPLMFTVFLAQFSAGLVIYWAWNNILSITQQWLIMRMENKNPSRPAVNSNKVKPKWKK